jgi:hypothetical protein
MIIRNKKSQALVEMAILAPLVLMAVGMLVTYVVKLNNDQYAIMQAFRLALAKSHETNKAIGYGVWDDRRGADVTNPILGKKTTSSGSGAVLWGIPSVEGQGQDQETALYVKINYLPGIDVTTAGNGSIAPRYFTVASSSTTVTNNDGHISGSRSGGVGEFMLYKVGGDNKIGGSTGIIIPYGRGH